MLRYTVKSNKKTELRGFPIRELYVSPDLLYISGVTDASVGLVNGEDIVIKSPYLIGSETNTINVETVRRQGIVKVSFNLPVKTITMPLNFPIYSDDNGESKYIIALNKKIDIPSDTEGDYIISSVTQNYVEYKGDICYFFDGTTSGYLIDHKFYSATREDESIEINSYLYIEDGKLVVGDYTYYADFSNEDGVELKLNKEHAPIEENDIIGIIDGYECKFLSVKKYSEEYWERASKFIVQKKTNPVIELDDVMYGGYKHYITIGEENYYLRDVYVHNEEEDTDEYVGYGLSLDGIFYDVKNNYLNEYLFEQYRDLPMSGSLIDIPEHGGQFEIQDSIINPTNGGCFLILVGSDGGNDITVGNFIIAESNSPIELTLTVETDYEGGDGEDGKKYVAFCGKKYLVEANLYDTVNISGEDYLITYLNNELTSGFTTINGEKMYLDIRTENGEDEKIHPVKAVLSNKIYYKKSEDDEIIKVDYGVKDLDDGYLITESSGVTINGNRHQVIIDENTDDDEVVFNYVIINEIVNLTLEVTDINGLSTYIAYPVVDDETLDDVSINELQREYCNLIVNNWKSFNFTLRKDTFGRRPLTVENGLMDSMTATLPYSISDNYLLENKIDILRVKNYMSFKLPLIGKTANNIRREDTISSDFVNYMKNEATNSIVDMEKDVYYPVWRYKDKNEYTFKPIQQIRFNLHFRNRNFVNWKIYEDDREFKDDITPNSEKSNWFVTDLEYYTNYNKYKVNKQKLHNSSDLLGLLNFTTEDVRYQASKISKSFLRLSFFSTNDPKTQVLLATSTVFLDENAAYRKYMTSKRNSDLIYYDVKAIQEDKENGNSTSDLIEISSSTISNLSEVCNDKYVNDETRLSSRIIINNKFNSDASSEGYYLYMFKDYSSKMREATIYMKVDFNHAGIGQSLSFMLPRRINNTGTETPLYLHYDNDVNELKKGFKMADIYNQIYIPIKLKFDDKTNNYVYYLPDSLMENEVLGVDSDIMEFNLFEIKFANESIIDQNRHESN